MTVDKLAWVNEELGAWQSLLEHSIGSLALDTIYDVLDLFSYQVNIFDWYVFEDRVFSYSFLH